MEKFSVGQKLVCILKEGWYNPDNGRFTRGPKFNEIVTFVSSTISHGFVCYYFEEYNGDCYYSEVFVPIIDDSILEEELKNIFETIEI